MQSDFKVESQDVINGLLEQIKQLTLSNLMLNLRIKQIQKENSEKKINL